MSNKSSIPKNLERKNKNKKTREETLLYLMWDTNLHENTHCRC